MITSNELVRAVRGPIILITIGTLFALDHFTRWGFHQTWPVILIVIGLLHLASSMASQEGHVGRRQPVGTPPSPPQAPPDSGSVAPQTPYSSEGQ